MRRVSKAASEVERAAAAHAPQAAYQPEPYRGDTVLLATQEKGGADPHGRLGWRVLVEPTPEVVRVDAPHADLFAEPASIELAAVCRQRLPRREMEAVLALAQSINTATRKEKLARVGVSA